MKYIVKNLAETSNVAKNFVKNIKPFAGRATVVGLYGDLGTGKTTFTQQVAYTLGVNEVVASPTFVIEKIYELGLSGKSFTHLVHIDAYRLEHTDELKHLGWQEIVSNVGNLVIVEWPERVGDSMPEHIRVLIDHMSPTERSIEIISL